MTDYEFFSNLFRLNEETGQLFWKQPRQGRPRYREAGSIRKHGYRNIVIDNKEYRAHRIVWLLMTGDWPKQDIDHINRKRADNRPVNLRDVSRSENLRNTNGHTATSGVKGVYLAEAGNWYVRKFGKYVGTYDTINEAAQAYEDAR